MVLAREMFPGILGFIKTELDNARPNQTVSNCPSASRSRFSHEDRPVPAEDKPRGWIRRLTSKSEIGNKMEPCHSGCCETLKEPEMNLGLCAVQLARIDSSTQKARGNPRADGRIFEGIWIYSRAGSPLPAAR